jgi:putative Ig domain-containing protein
MMSRRSNSRVFGVCLGPAFAIALLTAALLVAAGSVVAAPKPKITSPTSDSATVGVPYSYQITADQTITTWGATPLPPGLSFNSTTGLISGTPTTPNTYSIALSATNANGTGTATLTLTVSIPPTGRFVGFRLPDFQTPAGAGYTPRLMLQMGATDPSGSHPFNATLEVQIPGTTTWVPYNRFVGIDDSASWIASAPLPVRDSSGPSGVPQAFSTSQLTQSQPPGPAVYMKADPRSTRFGIFQMDSNPTGNSRIIDSFWPTNSSSLSNGYGGAVVDPGGPVEHAPSRFSGGAYYPATFGINSSTIDARDTATTIYRDNDNILRPADAIYPDPTANTKGTGSWTPYYYDPANPTTSVVYRPIILNRPFRNVAELGYAFRDLPWKTLDFFTDKSADTGLLDIFCIHDGPQSTTAYDGNGDLGNVVPMMVAGKVNPNSTQAAHLQSVFAGAILDELNPTGTGIVSATPTPPPPATSAPVIAANIVSATSTTPMQNKSELITRAGLPTTILPTPTPTTSQQANQVVKARREVVARAASSVSQSRVWNLLIDVVAQSGHYKPNATSLQNDFVVEGEQHYWVHVAIDRFTGQVIDKQIEVVNE